MRALSLSKSTQRWLWLAALCLNLVAGSGHAQQLSGRAQADIEALASLQSLSAGNADEMFAALGFKPNMQRADWEALSPVEQVEIMYRTAQAANPPQGDEVIRQMARITSERYESIRYDPLFKSALAVSRPGAAINWGKSPTAQPPAALSPAVTAQLEALSRYVEGAGEFGRVEVARRIFGLEPPRLERALRHRTSRAMLLAATALAFVPPPVQERLNRLLRDVHANFESAALDPALRAAAEREGSPREAMAAVAAGSKTGSVDGSGRFDANANGGGGGGGGGGSPARTAEAARRSATFDSVHYSQPGSRSYSRVLGRVGGRGGIVVGAPVQGEPSAGVPEGIAIDMAGQSCATKAPDTVFGAILIITRDHRTLRYGPVACDEAIAAKALVFDTFPEMPAWQPGEAIGLMTIDSPTPFIPADRDLNRSGRRFDVILHPALLDLPIGRSVALSDMKPSARRSLQDDAGGATAVSDWLAALESKEIVTWRWHDNPTRIRAIAGRISIDPASAEYGNTVLAFRAFSEMDAIKEDEAEKTGSHPDVGGSMPEFTKAAGVLTSQVAEYRRLESFMRTAAIVRWARLGGATFVGTAPGLPPRRAPTPDNLVVGWNGDWIAVAPRVTRQKRMADFCSVVPKMYEALQKASDEVRMSLLEQFVAFCRN